VPTVRPACVLLVLATTGAAAADDVAVTVRALKDEGAECRFLREQCDAARAGVGGAVHAWSETSTSDGMERLALARVAREKARDYERRIGTIVGTMRAKHKELPACVRECDPPDVPWAVSNDAAACDAAPECGR
jgi:hypothetical protein